MGEFTHFDNEGKARMVNVGEKAVTKRMARASATLVLQPETLERIRSESVHKGDVLGVARLAGIMATKRTDELIPLCHSLGIDSASVEFSFPSEDAIRIESRVELTGKTGVEMEALTAASVAALTIYDMCKSMDRAMVIRNVQLEEKSGGQSGHFLRS